MRSRSRAGSIVPLARLRASRAWLGALLVVGFVVSATPVHAQQREIVRLENDDFVWLDVVEDMATFEWTVDVVNSTEQTLRLRVVLEVLDDDDRVVNHDERGNPNDFVIITLEPMQTIPVKQQGALSYDEAAEVVQFRHRWELIGGSAR